MIEEKDIKKRYIEIMGEIEESYFSVGLLKLRFTKIEKKCEELIISIKKEIDLRK